MLMINTGHGPRTTIEPTPHATEAVGGALWVDLFDPDDAERSLAERATGLRVPTLADLSEIESSSRLTSENGALFMSAPMTYLDSDGGSVVKPLGFVLSDSRLMTVRFTASPVFDRFAEQFAAGDGPAGSADTFLGLLEAIVDRLADVLEMAGTTLDGLSRRVFRPDRAEDNSSRMDAKLRATLRQVGGEGERLSNLRASLLGIQRVVSFAGERGAAWVSEADRPRLSVLKQDLMSLTDYDAQLQGKVQFLLDATLGFINIEQNNGIKILTVVSVVGVPPTLVASIYGMNFKWMPELQWEYGYFYGLTVIVLSALLPLVWFKKKGWI